MKTTDRHARRASAAPRARAGVLSAAASAFALAIVPGFVAGTAHAQESSGVLPAQAQATTKAATKANARASDIGPATSAWLALQRSNAAAAPAQPTPGAEATLAYQRYLESFKSKIPERFDSSMGQGGNGLGMLVGYGGAPSSN
ncbi:DUF3613 domain-containing protein [Paraburkholderia kururiensis]|uniref:DUF3613 domain-containing protein n=1 Tax=Paraburkholderia kururiensis TaxID=984307 RepID=A0ABZ0WSG4_9BURK|nr:DUF3613 domain-containing protein [Paraburkholderia kururiensis]WQD80354.1 DUF3613 domain-containing protein [Paraburkholderia kururiensis]